MFALAFRRFFAVSLVAIAAAGTVLPANAKLPTRATLPPTKPLWSAKAHEMHIHDVRFSPNPTVPFVVTSSMNELKVFDADTGKLVLEMKSAGVISREISDYMLFLATWDRDNGRVVTITDLSGSGKEPRLLRHDAQVAHVIFHSEYAVLTITVDGVITLWDPILGKQRVKLQGQGLMASRDGYKLAIAGKDTIVRVVDGVDGKEQFQVSDARYPLGFSPDSKQLALMMKDGTIKVVDAATGKELHDLGPAHYGSFAAGDLFVQVGQDGTKLWNTRTWQVQTEFARAGVLSPDGKVFAAFDRAKTTLTLSDAASGKRRQVISVPWGDLEGAPRSSFFAPDGKSVAVYTMGAPGRAHRFDVFDVATGRLLFGSDGMDGSFSPDSRRLATVEDGRLFVWSMDDLRRVAK
jgi:WD40 repeat protein